YLRSVGILPGVWSRNHPAHPAHSSGKPSPTEIRQFCPSPYRWYRTLRHDRLDPLNQANRAQLRLDGSVGMCESELSLRWAVVFARDEWDTSVFKGSLVVRSPLAG